MLPYPLILPIVNGEHRLTIKVTPPPFTVYIVSAGAARRGVSFPLASLQHKLRVFLFPYSIGIRYQ
jgi:hypothetical protein